MYIIQFVGKANANSFTLPSIFDCLFVQRQNELSQEEQKKNQEEAKKLRLQVNLANPSHSNAISTIITMMSRVRTQMGVSQMETSCLRQKIGQGNSYRVRLAQAGFW